MDTNLKPCPFCGGAAGSGVTWSEHYGECGWVECGSCPGGMASDMGGTEAEAVAAWNTRADDREAIAARAEGAAAERARIAERLMEDADDFNLLHLVDALAIVQGGEP